MPPIALSLIIFSVVYACLMTEKTPRHIIVLGGAAVLILCRVLTFQDALHYVNWGTLLLLLGMFAIVETLNYSGFFERLAQAVVGRFGYRKTTLFFVLPLLTGCLSMVINNITVMLFMTRLTLQICRYVALEPVPLIIGEVSCANMLGAATLIGSPPNLLLAAPLGYGFKLVSVHMAPVVTAATLIFLAIQYLQHRREPASAAVTTRLETSKQRTFLIDFETLLFFVGLFVLVGALDHVGVFQRLAQLLSSVRNPTLLIASLLWLCAAASALVDNVPMALAMGYFIRQMALVSPGLPTGILAWAALTGLTLGGNMTPIGASPNVVAYGILEKLGMRIGWKRWAKLTVPPTLSALVAAHAFLWLKYRAGWY